MFIAGPLAWNALSLEVENISNTQPFRKTTELTPTSSLHVHMDCLVVALYCIGNYKFFNFIFSANISRLCRSWKVLEYGLWAQFYSLVRDGTFTIMLRDDGIQIFVKTLCRHLRNLCCLKHNFMISRGKHVRWLCPKQAFYFGLLTKTSTI